MEFTKRIVKRTLERGLTTIMTTHSDIPILTIAKLISEGQLNPEDVKIYYFTRDPWTKLREIKVYEDGTLDSLPDTEELVAHLF